MNRGRSMAMLALALAGCAFSGAEGEGEGTGSNGGGGGGGGGTGGGGGSSMPEPPRCKFTYVDVCGKEPGAALSYTAATTINTSNTASCTHVLPQAAGQPELCVLHAKSVTLSASAVVRAIGTRPLVIVSSSTISIAGTLDASSWRQTGSDGEVVGAGGEAMACNAFTRDPEDGDQGGGGGAGGSFSGKGGNGGNVDQQRDGGTAPNAYSSANINFLRGGCRGQTGATADDATNGGAPGAGGPPGGVIYLAASGEISLEGAASKIAANGGGGRGGGVLAGGGGGGAGGMIVLESKLTHRGGLLTANGGGGGQGGSYTIVLGAPLAVGGSPGDNGAMSAEAATGGDDLLTGRGGDGSDVGTRNGRGGGGGSQFGGGPDGAAGGGGGGAAGFIRVLGPSDGAGTVSPPL